MDPNPDARAAAPVTSVTGDGPPREPIDAVLNRLLCDLALAGDEEPADRSNGAAELAALVAPMGSPVLDRLTAGIAGADTSDAYEGTLAAFSSAWQVWLVHGDAGLTDGSHLVASAKLSAPAALASGHRVEDDVEALRADPDMAAMFVGEALDQLCTIEAAVLQLELAPADLTLLNDIFRPFHTVKGNAMAIGVMRIQELAHKVENLLDLARSGKHTLGPGDIDAVLEAVDVLTGLVNDTQARVNGQPGTDLEPGRVSLMVRVDGLVEAARTGVAPAAVVAAAPVASLSFDAGVPITGAAPAPPSAPSGPPMRRADDATAQATVKVDTRKLDSLVDMVGELVIAQSILQEDPNLLKAVDERLTRNMALLKRITSDLQRNAMSMRMMPIRQTFQKMARLVRDLSKKSGKPVDLVLSGEDTELDRRVVEDINDPLMHMIRNSMDHGIENAERRAAAGKRPEGRLALSAYHQGGSIVIAIQDDGGGLDTERILAKATAQGLIAPGETLSPAEIHQLIFKAGFSTAETVTDLSGRGVGMDVVRQNIDALRGRVEIQSTLGQGTTFLIKLPLTLAILDGLVLGVGNQRFVMPTFSVRESLRPVPEQVHSLQGRPCMIQVRDKLVPLMWLSEIFGIEGRETDACQAVVVMIEDDTHQVGLVVDQLLGKQEVVIKSLGEAFGHLRGVAGGAILGDGRVGLILDAHGIVDRERVRAA